MCGTLEYKEELRYGGYRDIKKCSLGQYTTFKLNHEDSTSEDDSGDDDEKPWSRKVPFARWK